MKLHEEFFFDQELFDQLMEAVKTFRVESRGQSTVDKLTIFYLIMIEGELCSTWEYSERYNKPINLSTKHVFESWEKLKAEMMNLLIE